MFSLIRAWIKGIKVWVNNRKASDLRRHRAHDDVIVMHPGPSGQPNPEKRDRINMIKII